MTGYTYIYDRSAVLSGTDTGEIHKKEQVRLEKQLESTKNKLNNPAFRSNANPAIIQLELNKEREFSNLIECIKYVLQDKYNITLEDKLSSLVYDLLFSEISQLRWNQLISLNQEPTPQQIKGIYTKRITKDELEELFEVKKSFLKI